MKKLMLLGLLMLNISLALAQTKSVSGVVISSEDNEPVIGASIRAKHHPKFGGTTNLEGQFKFSIPADERVLIVSYVGMGTQEIKVGSNLKIILKPASLDLEEIVVTGMGVKRSQKSLGYSVQQVKADELKTTRTPDLNNALAGKISGARFIGGSGATFDPGHIVLRGTSTLSATGSEPIYVVDGVITNKNMINMDDVKSINVLKGPAATAIYGSEGGNGAIIINTLGGDGGNTSGNGNGVYTAIDFSQTTTVEIPVNYFDFQQQYGGGYLGANSKMPIYKWKAGDDPKLKVLDGKRYYDYNDDASWGPELDGQPYIPFYAWDTTDPRFGQTAPWEAHGKNNILGLFRNGMTNTTNISFERGQKDHYTRVSFTNVDRKGLYYNSDAVRRFLSIKSSFSPMKNMYIDMDYKYTYRENHNPANEDYGGINPVYSFTQWGHVNVDVNDLKDDYIRPDGTYRSWNITDYNNFTPAYHNNPFALMYQINRYNRSSWNVFNTSLSYDFSKKLHASISVFGNMRNDLNESEYADNLVSITAKYEQYQSSLSDIRTQAKLSYSDRFLNDKLTVDANLYAEERSNTLKKLKGETQDGLSASGWYNLKSSKGKPKAQNETIKYKTRSVYGTLTLGLNNTYYADFSARNDWSSTLPEENNSYFFGGVSLATLVSNLIPKNDIVNYWKVRASMAQVGSTMGPYNVYQTYQSGKFGAVTYASNIRTLNNPFIKPTISTSYEIGTEFRLFNNRVWGDINLYTRTAKDQIIKLNITPASGFSTKQINAGKIQNKGIEVSLGGALIKTKDWKWDINFNIAKNVNKLLELDGERDDYRLSWYGFRDKAYLFATVGEPVGSIRANDWQYDANGHQVFQKRPNVTDKDKQMIKQYGEYYPLINKDPHEIGNVQPDFTGGFSTGLTWKNLSLRASLDFQVGGNLISVSNMFGEGSGLLSSTAGNNDRGGKVRDLLSNNGGVHVKGVDPDGKPVDSYIDAYYYYQYKKSNLFGPYLFDASYVKLRELSLGYKIPTSLLSKQSIVKAASLSVIASNPWLIYSGTPNLDPSEAINSFSGYLERGQTISSKSIGFTINLTF